MVKKKTSEAKSDVSSLLNALSCGAVSGYTDILQYLKELSKDYLTFSHAKKEIKCLPNRKKEVLKENVIAALKLKEDHNNFWERILVDAYIPVLILLFSILFGIGLDNIQTASLESRIFLFLLLIGGNGFILYIIIKINRSRRIKNIYFIKIIKLINSLNTDEKV